MAVFTYTLNANGTVITRSDDLVFERNPFDPRMMDSNAWYSEKLRTGSIPNSTSPTPVMAPGINGSLQYNNFGSFAGAGNAQIENDLLKITNVTSPVTQGRLKVSHKGDCGALQGLLSSVGLLLSLVQARVAF
jgi:hypothetical protein